MQAMLALFIIIVGNDWIALMYATMNASYERGWDETAAWCTCLYYVIFFFFAELLFINLLGALTIEMYLIEMDREKTAGNNDDIMKTLGFGNVSAEPSTSSNGPTDASLLPGALRENSTTKDVFSMLTSAVKEAFSRRDHNNSSSSSSANGDGSDGANDDDAVKACHTMTSSGATRTRPARSRRAPASS